MSLDELQISHDPRAYHQLHWESGQHGKGLIDPNNGSIHTWSVGDVQDGWPSHYHYRTEGLKALAFPDGSSWTAYKPFWIDPEGQMNSLEGHTPEDIRNITTADPRIAPPRDEWRFGAWTPPATINWRPGQYGKGLVAGGQVHTWPVKAGDQDEDWDYAPIGYPSHGQYKEMHRLNSDGGMASEFWINPGGAVSFFSPDRVDEGLRSHIQQADPRLMLTDVSNDAGLASGDWTFSKRLDWVL